MKRLLTAIMLLIFISSSAETILNREMKMYELENGLQVILIKTGSEPIMTIEIAVRNGAYTQTPENEGLSHLYEHMFFKGNSKWKTQEEYSKRIRELGILYNGLTSNESVRYYYTLPSKNMDPGLEFMSVAIKEPLFDSVELEKEKRVVMNEFNRDFSEPIYIFYQEVEKTMFEKYFYRKNAIGTRDVILNATVTQMNDIKNRYYTPNNSALIIVGDFDFDAAEKTVYKYFADWKRGNDPVFPTDEHPMLEKNKSVTITEDVSVSNLTIQFRGPDVGKNDEDTYSMDILTEMMRMKSSPLYKKLVETGLVNSYSAGYYTQQDGGTFSFYATLKAENIDKVREIFFDEVSKMTKKSYFKKEIIAQAKERTEMNFLHELESTEDFALNVGFFWCIADIDYFRGYLDSLKKVDAEKLASTVSRYISGKYYVTGIMTDEESAEKYGL